VPIIGLPHGGFEASDFMAVETADVASGAIRQVAGDPDSEQ
jgi:hypothetical protein